MARGTNPRMGESTKSSFKERPIMSVATATTPEWRYNRSPCIEDSQRYSLERIDFLSAVGSYGLSNFRRLLAIWRAETFYQSSVSEKMNHPAFKQIIAMRERAVPWIISELKIRPDFLFMALHLITKHDPTPEAAKGDPRKIVEAWLQWAERENIGIK